MKIDTARLAKVLALMDSAVPGERDAARERAGAMLTAAGKAWRDLPTILGAQQASPSAPRAPVFTDVTRSFDGHMEAKEPGWKAKVAAERVQRARDRAAFRAAVIAKYGSAEAALAPTSMEAVVDAAVAPFAREELHDYANGRFPRRTLDGWSGPLDQVPARVDAAICAALPLPRTIAEAKAEYDAWGERDRELEAIRGEGGDTWLSLGCILRQSIISDLLQLQLRAVTLDDAIVRHRASSESGSLPSGEEADAMLADLEHLAGMQAVAAGPVQDGQQGGTATARRAEVLRLVEDPATAALSDREIARRVGVSPQTVGNIRRRAGAPAGAAA